MWKKTTISLIFLILSLFWYYLFAYANSQTIHTDQEFQKALDWMYQNQLTQYSQIQEFRPEYTLRRDEAAHFFINFVEQELEQTPAQEETPNFEDLENAHEDLIPSIEKAAKYWLIRWDGNSNNFRPADPISRAEFFTVIVRALDGNKDENTNPWWENYFQKARELGLTNETDSMAQNRDILRYEAGLVLFRSVYDEWEYEFQPQTQTMEIHFDEEMDPESVLANIQTNPQINYEANFSDDWKMLKLEILDEFSTEETLLVNIAQDTQTAAGKNLPETLSKKFKIDASPAIDFVSPQGDIQDLNQNITVRFSSPMLPLTALDEQENCPIQINPEIDWKCVWITTSTFQFRPKQSLPIWAEYDINIPSGIQNQAWNSIRESKSFQIKTPDFEILEARDSIEKDQPLTIIFNDYVDLSDFEENFSIEGFENHQLNFDYAQEETNIEGEYKILKNTIEIFPNQWDRGYDKEYNFQIHEDLTSQRWNISIWENIDKTFQTNKFITNYNPFVYIDPEYDQPNLVSNMKKSNNQNIITSQNPKILLEFYEEVDLDESLFDLPYDFDIAYAKESKDWEIQENKENIILQINWNIQDSLDINVLASNISWSDDISLTFETKENNKIKDFENIDYKISCLETKEQIPNTRENQEAFEFDGYGKVQAIREVSKRRDDEKCPYEEWKNKYILQTNLDPEFNYNLTINENLLDKDNYPLDQAYEYSFDTPKAKNEDKHVEILGQHGRVLLPSNISPLTLWTKSVNLDKIKLEVCQWDLNIKKENFIEEKACNTKQVDIQNKWFQPSLNTIDLEQVFDDELDSKMLSVKVFKAEEDKTESQIERQNYSSRIYEIWDLAASIKSAKESILRLRDYQKWENISDWIQDITAYPKDRDYRVYERKLQEWIDVDIEDIQEISEKNIDFQAKQDWLYKLESIPANSNLLVSLDDWRELLVDNTWNNLSEWETRTYLFTDRPLYKPWDEVNIKWIVRNLYSKAYQIESESIDLQVRDSRWNLMIDQKAPLNELWDFAWSFKLPDDANLGEYSIRAGENTHSFHVQEFETPDFEVSAESRQDSYLKNEKAQIDISAKYFMWLPVADGEVSYEINTEEYIFDGAGFSDFHFGDQPRFWPWYEPISTSQFFDRGELTLDQDWKWTLEFDLEEWVDEDRIYNLTITVQDPQTWDNISQNLNFKAFRTEKFLGFRFDDFAYSYLDTAEIDFIALDEEGNTLANRNLDFQVKKIERKYGEISWETTKDKNLVYEQTLTSQNNWQVSDEFVFEDTWEYEFVVSTPDWNYKTSKTFHIGWANVLSPSMQENKIDIILERQEYQVWENAKAIIQSPKTDIQALITVEKMNEVMHSEIIDIDEYNQEIQIPVKEEYIPNFDIWAYLIQDISANEDELTQLESIRDEMSDIEQDLQERLDSPKIPIPPVIPYYEILPPFPPQIQELDEESKEKYERWMELRSKEQELLGAYLPSYYIWSETVRVDTDYMKLNWEVSLDQESYQPGDSQTIELEITDNQWNPINWQATIRVIDQALLSMMDNKVDILDFFYSKLENNVSTAWNLENIIQRILFPDDLDFAAAAWELDDVSQERAYYQAETESMAADETMDADMLEDSAPTEQDDDIDIREQFEDLAYYQAVVDVQDWQAQVEVDQLPDNLTTWVVDGFVHTQDSKVWEFETDFQVQKPIGILEQIPRFLISGDELVITAQIVNNTDSTKTVDIQLDITNAQNQNPNQEISVDSQSSKLVKFPVKIEWWFWVDAKSEITIYASSENYQDAIRQERAIHKPSTAEYVFSNGSTEDVSYEEQVKISEIMKENWYMEITMWASILTNLMHNLDDYFDYPGENLRNRLEFLDIAESMRSLYQSVEKLDEFEEIRVYDRDNNEYSISAIESKIKDEMSIYQEDDGGLRIFQDSCWHARQSCSNFALSKQYLQMDLDIDGVDNEKLLDYYKSELEERLQRWDSSKWNISYFMPLAVHWEYDFVNEYFDLADEPSNKEKIQYINLYDLMPEEWERADEFYDDLKNSILIEARGSLLPADLDYSNNIISTARMLDLMIDYGEEERLQVENMARWLLANRGEEWAFHARNIVPIIDALEKYVDQTGELDDVDFDAAAYFEENNIMEASFDMDNRFGLAHDKFDFQDYVNFGETHSLWFEKDGEGRLYYDVGLRYHIPNDQISPRDEWMIVSRNYYDYDEYQDAHEKQCFTPIWRWVGWSNCRNVRVKNIDSISEAKHGDFVVWEVELTVPYERNDVVLRDYIPSGAEILNVDFDTVWDDVAEVVGQESDRRWWFDHIEQRNDMVYLYAEHLRSGTYTYTYVMQASYEGSFNVRPARAELIERPEVFGRSSGMKFEVSR